MFAADVAIADVVVVVVDGQVILAFLLQPLNSDIGSYVQ